MAQLHDPRRHLAATCKKKEAFRMGQYGALQGALDGLRQDHPLVNAIRGVESGLDAIVGATFGTVAQVAGVIAGGATGVMETVLGPSGADVGGSNFVQSVLKKVNSGVHDRVLGAADGVIERVTSGNVDSLSEFIDPFNEAVSVANNLFTTPNSRDEIVRCSASPYAADLISRGVKQKYMVVVQFDFAPEYQSSLGELDFAFEVKYADRPNVNFEYEDVNLYNYRTKVPKKTTYEPVTMRFYDDMQGQSLAFYAMYLKMMSPIANLDPSYGSPDGDRLEGDMAGLHFPNYEEWGDSDNLPSYARRNGAKAHGTSQWAYAASLGTLHNATDKQAIKRARIFHIGQEGGLMDVYTFINPKITQLELDELDASVSEANEVAITMEYDTVIVEPRLSASPLSELTNSSQGGRGYNIEKITSGKNGLQAKYPIRHYGPPMDQWYRYLSGHPAEAELRSIASDPKNKYPGTVKAGQQAKFFEIDGGLRNTALNTVPQSLEQAQNAIQPLIKQGVSIVEDVASDVADFFSGDDGDVA